MLKLTCFLSFILLTAHSVSAQTYKQVMDCHKSLISSAFEHYMPAQGQLICEDGTATCYLAYDDLETYKIETPTSPSFVTKEILLDRPNLQIASHYLLTWIDPKTSQNVYVDIVRGESAAKYARSVDDAQPKVFTAMTPFKSNSSLAQDVALKNIESQLALISKNISQKSYPYGQDTTRFKEASLQRLASCNYMISVQNILVQLKLL